MEIVLKVKISLIVFFMKFLRILNNFVYSLAKSELFRGFSITTICNGTAKLIMILSVFYCTHHLTKDEFGTYSFIRNTLNISIAICANKFSQLGTKFAAEMLIDKSSLKKLYLLFLFSLFICLLTGFAVYVCPDQIMIRYLENGLVVKYIKIVALLLPVFVIPPLTDSILIGLKKFKIAGVIQIIISFSYLIFLYIGISINGVEGAILSLFAYYILYAILTIIVLLKINHTGSFLKKVDNVFSELPSLYKMVLPVFVMSFIDAPTNWVAQSVIAKYSSYASVGTLTVIEQIRSVIVIIPSYFFLVFTPFVTNLRLSKSYYEYFLKFKNVIMAFIPIVLITIVLLIIGGRAILSLFGNGYIEDYSNYVIGVVFLAFHLPAVILKINLIVMEHQCLMLFISMIGCALFFITLFSCIYMGLNSLSACLVSQVIREITVLSFCSYVFVGDKRKYLVKGA